MTSDATRQLARAFRVSAVTVALLLPLAAADGADTVLVRQEGLGYGYGGSKSEYVTQTMDIVLGDRIEVVPDLADAAQVMGSSALWLDLPAWNERLAAEEIANLSAFIQTGRRVVIWGDRTNFWGDWDADVLGTVGSSVASGYFDGTVTTVLAHPLTVNVESITVHGGALATLGDGASLFGENVATLWGPDENVLIVLDTAPLNCVPDSEHIVAYFEADNAAFATNIVTWIAVPEPATMALLAAGLAAMLARRAGSTKLTEIRTHCGTPRRRGGGRCL